jgi:sugar porter (SP) family MFS transporter
MLRSSTAKAESSLWTNRKCLLICCVVAIANMQYGFDSAAIGALQAMPGFLRVFGYEDPSNPTGYGIDPVVQQLIASLLTLGSFLSSLLAGLFSHWFGRKQGLWLACLLNVVSCVIMIATTSTGALYVGRLLLGISNGFLVTFSNVYTSEAAPAHLRGIIVALFAWWVNIGSLIGAIIVNYTRVWLDARSYQIPIGCLFIVPVLLSIALWFVPESPRYLVNQGREEAGKRALRTLRGNAVDEQGLELEWAEMIRGIEEERRNAKSVSFVDMFRGTDLRRTLLCYGMIACQTASGIWFLIAYQTYFFIQGGVTKGFEYSIMTTCFGFLGVNLGMYAMRHLVGRRTILIVGATACGLAQLGTALAYTTAGPGTTTATNCLVAFLTLHKFFYNGCVGAASYPVATEVVSTRLRAWTVGTATGLGYVLAWLTSFCSPYFINPTELNW